MFINQVRSFDLLHLKASCTTNSYFGMELSHKVWPRLWEMGSECQPPNQPRQGTCSAKVSTSQTASPKQHCKVFLATRRPPIDALWSFQKLLLVICTKHMLHTNSRGAHRCTAILFMALVNSDQSKLESKTFVNQGRNSCQANKRMISQMFSSWTPAKWAQIRSLRDIQLLIWNWMTLWCTTKLK